MARARNVLLAALTILLLMAAFAAPALINRSPFIYPDTVGYLQSGRSALVAAHVAPREATAANPSPASTPAAKPADDGVSTARSVYYGAVFAMAQSLFGIWAMPVIQALVCIISLWLALGRLTDAPRPVRVGIIAVTGLVAGAGVFADTVMPDVFAGLLILAVAVALVHGQRLSRGERAWWLLLVTASILFHKSHLLVAAAMLGVGAIITLTARRNWTASLLMLCAAFGVGAAGHVAADVAVRVMLHKAPTSPPFIMARMIGDGTAGSYLRETCPRAPLYSCALLPHLPMTENEFLWDRAAGGFAAQTPDGKQRLIDEEGVIAKGVMETHGASQILASADNVARQITLVGATEYSLAPPMAAAGDFGDVVTRYKAHPVSQRLALLNPISRAIAVAYFLSLAILAWFLFDRRPARSARGRSDLVLATLLALVGMTTNAVVCGAISGVFDRYQGRVAWLATVLALSWICAGLTAAAPRRVERVKGVAA